MRVAQISGTSGCFAPATPFPFDRWKDLEKFRPCILVGALGHLLWVAERMRSGQLNLTSVDRCLFVLSEIGSTPLDDVARVLLWQSYGVPVFELFVNDEGVLLAFECEAHDGWHVEPEIVFTQFSNELRFELPGRRQQSTGLTGKLVFEDCACGRTSGRIAELQKCSSRQSSHRLAAIA